MKSGGIAYHPQKQRGKTAHITLLPTKFTAQVLAEDNSSGERG
jgi:hypothetical protein